MTPGALDLARVVLDACKRAGLKVATAESCTGGLVAATLTAIPGSSAVVERGWVTYSNLAKHQELAVPTDLLDRFGAVSEQVARAMAEGALANSAANLSVAVTGIAGPDGGTAEKPVGLVHFACARRSKLTAAHWEMFAGDRAAIRDAATLVALSMLREAV